MTIGPYAEDDSEFRAGTPGKHTREIYMIGGKYLFCEILEFSPESGKGRARTPSGREFDIVPYMGTWGENRSPK